MKTKTLKYTLEDYNHHGVLHVPLWLVILVIYLLKHWLIAAFPLLEKTPVINAAFIGFPMELLPTEHSSPLLLYTCIPTLLVAVSMARRLPTTRSPFLRWVWQNGRAFLLTSLYLELGLLVLYLALGTRELDGVLLTFMYFDGVSIVYLMRSRRVQDVFAEFPKFTERLTDSNQ